MCGIVGWIQLTGPDKRILVKMRDTLVHRGPDRGGILVDKGVGLAFRRLSILDLSSAGMQPMSNEDKSVWLVFNGEFYNHNDWRRKLKGKGHTFRSTADTEAIIHLYEEKGVDFLKEMNGMFALALWDQKRQRIILARDRLGQKPLYYCQPNPKTFLFASEPKAILRHPQVKREIDSSSLKDYFRFGYALAPHSIFKNIFQLPPAHYSIFNLKTYQLSPPQPYWQLEFCPDHSCSLADWQEEFSQLFSEAVKLRLQADVEVGIFLSGGLDSSAVVKWAHQHSSQPLNTFSVGFQERDYDESQYSRQIASLYQTNHTQQIIDPRAIEILPQLVYYFDEPFDDSSAVPTFHLAKLARQKVKVALSGDGGDELLGGYHR
ncbi:asparagine synthase (glutamine-hydrolyzing), partial [Candidatus Parcubacteria bacterium]